ncbi:MAG TPA: sigma-70 family RNA polymerase sigma factor [Pseudonocardiaceae bacterium]|nr:sigma-70 family RNA polymerase sigma factor [Pseudonocardiaceae bacterium]
MVVIGRRDDPRVDAEPKDRNTGEDPPWWELTGYQRHGACLVAARNGDRQALDDLVQDLSPLVWHVARAQGIARAQAEDVVQTVWLTLLRNLHSVAEPRAVARWLITTTRREAIRSLRSVNQEQPLVDEVLDQLQTRDGLPEQEVLQRDRNIQLWSAFRQLSQRCQELLRLTVLAGRAEYNVVAAELHMPRGSIGPTRSRCLTILRGVLTNETEGGSS